MTKKLDINDSKSAELDENSLSERSSDGGALSQRDFIQSVSSVDLEMLSPGWKFCLVPLKVRGETVRTELEKACKNGWTPVERKEYPQFALPDELEALVREGEVNHESKFLIDRDRMLMKMPLERYNSRLREINRETQDQSDRLEGQFHIGANPMASLNPDKFTVNMDAAFAGNPTSTGGKLTRGSPRTVFGE